MAIRKLVHRGRSYRKNPYLRTEIGHNPFITMFMPNTDSEDDLVLRNKAIREAGFLPNAF